MTVEANTAEYVDDGDGVTTVFPFPSRFMSNDDITVALDGVVVTTGFSITGAGTPSGGNVTFSVAPADGVKVARLRDPAIRQLVDFAGVSGVRPPTIGDIADRQTMVDMALARRLARAVRISDFEVSPPSLVLPSAATRAGTLLGFDTDGGLTTLAPSDEAGNVSAPAIHQLATGELPLSKFGPFTGTSGHSAKIQKAFDEAAETKRPLRGTYREGGYYLEEPVYLRSGLTLNNVPGNVFRRAYWHPNIMEGAFCTPPAYEGTEVFSKITLNDLWFDDLDNDRHGSFLTLKCDDLVIRGFRAFKLSGGVVTHFLGNGLKIDDVWIDCYGATDANPPEGYQIWSDCLHFSFCSNVKLTNFYLRGQDDGIGFTHDPASWGNMLPKRNPISQNIIVQGGFIESKIAHGVRFGGEQLTIGDTTYLIDPDVAYKNVLVDDIVIYGVPDVDGTPREGAAITLNDTRDNATVQNDNITISNIRGRNTTTLGGPEVVSIIGYAEDTSKRNWKNVKLHNVNVEANENGAGPKAFISGVEDLEISDCKFGGQRISTARAYNGVQIAHSDRITFRDTTIYHRGSGLYPVSIVNFNEVTFIDTIVAGGDASDAGGTNEAACIYLGPNGGDVGRLTIDGLTLKDAVLPIEFSATAFATDGIKARNITLRGITTPTFPVALMNAIIRDQSGRLSPLQVPFSAANDLTTDAAAAVQAALTALKTYGGGTLDLTGDFKIINGVALDSGDDITIFSGGGRIYYPQTANSAQHLFRITNSDRFRALGLNIYSDSGLVRDNTGFAVQIAGSRVVSIEGCSFEHIASAAVWIDTTQDIRIIGNTVLSAKADGIHLSDGCVNFTIVGNTLNATEDDAIAVVRDTGAGIPNRGTISGNTINGTIAAHGISLISCEDVTVSGNNIAGTAAGGIGNYIWSGTTDRAKRLTIVGNTIDQGGSAPLNADSACGIFIGGADDSTIAGNVITNVDTGHAYDAEISGIRAKQYDRLVVSGNTIRSVAGYGVLVPDNIGSGLGKLTVANNTFQNVSKSGVRAVLAASGVLGPTAVAKNVFTETAYLTPFRLVDIANAGADRVSVIDNAKMDGSSTYDVDAGTCSDIVSSGNT